jgi:hypothetical protein
VAEGEAEASAMADIIPNQKWPAGEDASRVTGYNDNDYQNQVKRHQAISAAIFGD